MGEASDRSRYVMGDRDEAATAANTAYKNERKAAARKAAGTIPRADRDKLSVNIVFRVTEETAAALDALTEGTGTRNTTARDILLGALEAGQGEDKQREKGTQP